jgi:hypothetical protein
MLLLMKSRLNGIDDYTDEEKGYWTQTKEREKNRSQELSDTDYSHLHSLLMKSLEDEDTSVGEDDGDLGKDVLDQE